MKAGNDVAGLLFGDHASLVITKVFVDLNLSPNYASVGFLVAGLLGAGLQVGTGIWALAGAVLLVLYYVLDCVDGEVARWQKVVNVHWGYFDYLFHMLIKPLAFFGIGLGCHLSGDGTWTLIAAFAAAVSTLWRKILIEIPGILFLKDVLRKGTAQRPADAPASSGSATPAGARTPEPFRLRADLVTLRAILTNFDVGLLFLTVASALDLALDPLQLGPLGTHSFRALWLAYYGIVLPFDFLDYLITYLRKRHFSTEMTRLLSAAHDFRAEEREQR